MSLSCPMTSLSLRYRLKEASPSATHAPFSIAGRAMVKTVSAKFLN